MPAPRYHAVGETPDTYVFDGSGIGNNVGMSQYSARGMALEGWTFDGFSRIFPGNGPDLPVRAEAPSPRAGARGVPIRFFH